MKKITFNALLNHKAHNYKPMQIEVEKVITLYGREFEKMRGCPINDNPYITEHSDLMYIPYTDEQKQLAGSVDLPEFLRMRGETLERAGREYKLIYHDESGRHDSITMRVSYWFDHKNMKPPIIRDFLLPERHWIEVVYCFLKWNMV